MRAVVYDTQRFDISHLSLWPTKKSKACSPKTIKLLKKKTYKL